MLKITNTLLKKGAEKRGWRVDVLSEQAGILRYTLPTGKKVILKSLLSPFTSSSAVEVADDKYVTFLLAKELGVKVPETHIIQSITDATHLLEKYHSVVVKPLDSAHGNGITTNITRSEDLENALRTAREFSDTVLLQPYISGNDIRLLYIGGELAAASVRTPATIIGDGVHSLKQLIDIENKSSDRGENYQKKLNYIDNNAAERHLGEGLNDIPKNGEACVVVGTVNIGTGGTAEDITSSVDTDVVMDGKRVIDAAGLQTGAVDFIGTTGNYYLLEINANPSLGLHDNPTIGSSQPVAELFISWIEKQLR